MFARVNERRVACTITYIDIVEIAKTCKISANALHVTVKRSRKNHIYKQFTYISFLLPDYNENSINKGIYATLLIDSNLHLCFYLAIGGVMCPVFSMICLRFVYCET